ncbi:hypothetical protein JOL62DRAFT_166593 [Phyllosticta paracitricarpa]|uniref:Uncharacterized protein n=1 Tax=Phyllosticta paracitricarpa TaxID=2016321 RepID=A0ABR1N6H0_9PEZI
MSLGIRRLLLAFFFASSTIASPVPQLSPKLLFPRFSNTSTTSPDTPILTPQSVNTPNAIQSVHAADTGIPFVVPVTLITSDGSIIQETSTPPVTPSSTPHPLTGTFSSASTPAAFSQTPKYNLSTPNPGLSGGFQGAETSADLIPTTTPAQNSSSNIPATRSTETLSRPSTPSNQFTLSLGPSTPTSLPSTPTLTPIRTPNQVSTPLAANTTVSRKTLLSSLPSTPTDAASSTSRTSHATPTAHSTPLVSTPNGLANLTSIGTPAQASQSGTVYVTTTVHPVQSSVGTLRKTTTILTTVTPGPTPSSSQGPESAVYVTTTVDPTQTLESTLHLTTTVRTTITPAQQSSTPATTPQATPQSSRLADSGSDGSPTTQESQKLPQASSSKTSQSTPFLTTPEAATTTYEAFSTPSSYSTPSPSQQSSAPSAASSPSASRQTADTTSPTQAPASSTTPAPVPSPSPSSAADDDDDDEDGITIIPVDPSISTYTETTTHIKTVTVKETETTTLRETVTARETVTIQETDAPRVTVTAYGTLMMKLGE